MVLRAALLQMRSGRDIAANAGVVVDAARQACERGVDYLQTPEMTTIVERDREALARALASHENAHALDAFSAAARDFGLWLHIGSMAVSASGARIANRAHLFAPDGSLAAVYDKIHLFDVDLDGGESWRESDIYEAGDRAALADITVGADRARLGLTICCDLRFPQLYRSLARAGADILAAPAAFTRRTGEAHWHVLQRARAIENRAYVASAAQGGRHADGRETYGRSLIVDPDGRVVAEAANDEPGLLFAEVDLDLVVKARRGIPSLENGRDFTAPVVRTPVRLRAAS